MSYKFQRINDDCQSRLLCLHFMHKLPGSVRSTAKALVLVSYLEFDAETELVVLTRELSQ